MKTQVENDCLILQISVYKVASASLAALPDAGTYGRRTYTRGRNDTAH